MNQLICEKCGTANESGTMHCRQCGGKLVIKEEKSGSKVGRSMRKFIRKVLLVIGILIVIVIAGIVFLLLKTSGFPEPGAGKFEVRKIEKLSVDIYKPYPQTVLLTQDEANALVIELLKRDYREKNDERKLDVFFHNDRRTVSLALYSKAFGFISNRCEVGFLSEDDNEPELKYVRLGLLYMPGFLKEPVAKFFERQLLNEEGRKLAGRVDKMYPQGKTSIIVKLEKD